ncbi:tetratricopeptide repeat protein [Bacillus shivajii]|uniref:helix-turn-helix domain-containing protein n=1 Tax=Bacillus shivajii TaxID=1983719 RepID=UPI001CFA5F1D|nr:helix-turn-helix transcriptional regulator [Bacillus shivajii]UCZ53978.1 tetratricopeptide repeat protein [Bacillus shivajii]
MHIGNRLKKIRKLNRVSQLNLCKGIVSTSHYSNIESGRYVPSTDILESIAQRLQVPTSYLLNVHEHSPELDKLLAEYEELIESDLKEAKAFVEKQKKKFEYIPSIYQEAEYLLLKCLHDIKLLNLKEAEKSYEEIKFYIQEDELESYNHKLKFKYTYVSGLLIYEKRNYIESYHYFSKASMYTEDEGKRVKIIFNLGLICYYLYNLTKALEYVQSARTMYLEHHKWRETVECYILQGMILNEMQNYEEAEKVLQRGFNLAEEKKLDANKAKILHNLGNTCANNCEFEKSLNYYKSSIKIKKTSDPNNIFVTYYTLAKVYFNMSDFHSLKKLLLEVKEISTDEFELYRIKLIEAKMEYLLLNYDVYEKYMKEAIEYFYKKKFFIDIEGECKHLSDYYYEQKKYKSAHYYLSLELDTIKKIYKEPRV